jgi:transcriptional regulator with XRE-family HTH domain
MMDRAAFAKHFGDNLARRRQLAGLSQEELGFRADLHRSAVGQLERGERVPRADTIVRLAGVLGMAPGDLLAGLEWEPISYMAGGYRVSSSEPDAQQDGRED